MQCALEHIFESKYVELEFNGETLDFDYLDLGVRRLKELGISMRLILICF